MFDSSCPESMTGVAGVKADTAAEDWGKTREDRTVLTQPREQEALEGVRLWERGPQQKSTWAKQTAQ